MLDRVEIAREDSDTSLFLHLLYLGEMLTKVVAGGLIAAIVDDPDRHRYRQIHRLVRADGIGEWSHVIDGVLTGTASQHLLPAARDEQQELTQRLGGESWQYQAVALVNDCLKVILPGAENLPSKVEGRRWFSLFAHLRNKTRGHGAPSGGACSQMCQDLEASIQLMIENFSLFRRPWAYLYRNLSGKYRVTTLAGDTTPFKLLKSTTAFSYADGVYVHFDKPVRVELMISDVEARDFFVPNGGFTDKRFELLSYITNDRADGDSALYMSPASDLPPSETQGVGNLDAEGNCWTNLPPTIPGYIHRQSLEAHLRDILLDDRHPVVTLAGRGGIGKTSLALSVLHQLTDEQRFGAVLWFSARDIDLLAEGPKLVRPHVLTERDIAQEIVRLMAPSDVVPKDSHRLKYLAEVLANSPIDQPLLFVFDNFETVQSPASLYTWLDTYIRSPNKILITTRSRDFKADYPVEVLGMTEEECDELVTATAMGLGISAFITDIYRRELFRESDGHPYVVKILLGEVAKARSLVKVERIVAGKDTILDALFERTYAGLSPGAKRVFLTLCNWRSAIPQVAVEAVLLRSVSERIDVDEAIEELRRSSFVEISVSEQDDGVFLTIPLVAALFGRRKLKVSPHKAAVEADTNLLHMFGAAQQSDIRHGIGPRIERMFRDVSERLAEDNENLDDYLPMLEFLAARYPRAWMLLAHLNERAGGDLERTKSATLRYLEAPGEPEIDRQRAWKKQADLCQRTFDRSGEVHALVEMCEVPGITFAMISHAADRVNRIFSLSSSLLNGDEKRILAGRLITIMSSRLSEAEASDHGQLAWLYIHVGDRSSARHYTERGLQLDPGNDHLLNLKRRHLG